jgi:hypothetical protein
MQLQYMQMLPKLANNPANKIFVVPADMAGLAGLATSVAQMTQNAQLPQGAPNGQLPGDAPGRLGDGKTGNGAIPQLNAANQG